MAAARQDAVDLILDVPQFERRFLKFGCAMLFELRAAARGRFLFTKGARREHRGAMLLSSRVAGYLPANKPALVEENVGSSE